MPNDPIDLNPRLQPESEIKGTVFLGDQGDGKLLRTKNLREYEAVPAESKLRSLVGLVEADGRIRLLPSRVYCAQTKADGEISRQDTLVETELSHAERSTLLIDSFGSARQRRALHSRLLNEINSESLDSAVSYAKDSVDMSKIEIYSEGQANLDSCIDLLPRCNLEATRPEDVYMLSDIVTDKELDMLHDEANVLAAMSLEQLGNSLKLCQWSYYREHLLNRPREEKECLRLCALLTFHKFLMQLYMAGVRKINQRVSVLIDAPAPIRRRLFDEFVSTTEHEQNCNLPKRVITSRSKDRLLNQILILALFIDGFSVNLNTFMHDLRLTRAKVINAAESIGCQVKTVLAKPGTKHSIAMAVLRTPVKFPLFAAKRRK